MLWSSISTGFSELKIENSHSSIKIANFPSSVVFLGCQPPIMYNEIMDHGIILLHLEIDWPD